jgi:glycosyltransferase involved in cell wall biosynthesis
MYISDRMKLLLFFPSRVELSHGGGIRPYNIGKELKQLDYDVHEIWGWKTGRINKNQLKNYYILLKNKLFQRDSILFAEGVSSKTFTYLMYGSKWILDYSDDPILQMRDLGIHVPEKYKIKINGRSQLARDRAVHILFPSNHLLNYYTELKTKSTVVMNASDPSHFNYSPLIEDNKNKFRIGLLTGLAPGRGVDLLVDACKIVYKEYSDIELYIGYQPAKESIDYVNKLINQNKTKWIKFITGISYFSGANEFYQACDITVIPHVKNFYMDAATPVKLFDSMACGRPLVVTDCIEQAKIITETNSGLVCEHNPIDMAENICKLINDRKLLLKLSVSARNSIVKEHSWAHRAKIIRGIINKL